MGRVEHHDSCYYPWCSSTLHIRWGLCECLCLVLVCRGRYGLGKVFLLFILGPNLGRGGPVRGLRGEEEGGGVRSVTGAAGTILLFHTISARPSKQLRMVGSTLGVYSFGLIFVSARTNKRHHHHWSGDLAVVLWRSRERVDLDQRSLLKTVGLPWNRLQRVAGGAEQVQGRQCSRERCLEVFRPVQRAQQAVAGSGSTRCVAHARASGQTLYNTACCCPHQNY